MRGEAKLSLSPLNLGNAHFTDWTNFRRVEKNLKHFLLQMYFCHSSLLSKSPLPNKAQASPAMGNLLSKDSAFRLWTAPRVTEFFLLSSWNLSSCNFHPLFLVICLRPRKKQAHFPFSDSNSAPRREAVGEWKGVMGRKHAVLSAPQSPLLWNGGYKIWLTGWLWIFKKMCIRHLAQFL